MISAQETITDRRMQLLFAILLTFILGVYVGSQWTSREFNRHIKCLPQEARVIWSPGAESCVDSRRIEVD